MSDKYAIIRLKDKQFFVREGTKIKVFELNKDDKVEVLLLKDDKSLEIGEPLVSKGGVVLTKLGDKKIKTEVRRYRSKSRYRKNKSHSQVFTFLKVTNLNSSLKSSSIKAESKKEESVKKAKTEKKAKSASKKIVSKTKRKVTSTKTNKVK